MIDLRIQTASALPPAILPFRSAACKHGKLPRSRLEKGPSIDPDGPSLPILQSVSAHLSDSSERSLTRTSHKFEKRCEARQNEIRDGSVLAHVTKRIAAITLPRTLVVLRFLLNSTEETDCIWPNPTAPCYLANYSRSAETGEIFGLSTRVLRPQRNPLLARPRVSGRTRFLLTLMASLFALFADTAASQPPDRRPAEAAGDRRAALFEIQIGEQMVSLELAVTPHEQERGLMFRKSLDPRKGMLFVYPRGGRRSFWMRNTSIPLDLSFFSEDGILREIRPLYPFDESPVVSRRRDIKFAVEMRQGWYSAHGVRPGSSLDLQALREALKARGIDPEAFSL